MCIFIVQHRDESEKVKDNKNFKKFKQIDDWKKN